MSHLNIELPLVKFDAMLAKYLISTTEDNKISTIARLFDVGHLVTDEEIFGKGTKLALPDDEILFDHLARKIRVLARAKEKMMAELIENEQEHLLSDMELPLAEVLAKMEITGISVSQNTLEEIGAENEEKLASLTREIYDLAGE